MEKIDKKANNYEIKAVLTVEAAYLFVIFFSIFVIIIHTIFYYHDKNILLGAVKETAVLWAQLERNPDKEIENSAEAFYQERISGKLILFSGASVTVNQTDEVVEVTSFAEKGFMKVTVYGKAIIVRPEEKIRKKRIVESWIGEEE